MLNTSANNYTFYGTTSTNHFGGIGTGNTTHIANGISINRANKLINRAAKNNRSHNVYILENECSGAMLVLSRTGNWYYLCVNG